MCVCVLPMCLKVSKDVVYFGRVCFCVLVLLRETVYVIDCEWVSGSFCGPFVTMWVCVCAGGGGVGRGQGCVLQYECVCVSEMNRRGERSGRAWIGRRTVTVAESL